MVGTERLHHHDQSFDLRPGGVWRFVMHGPDGRDYQNRITFEEVVRPKRIVYRHGGGDDVRTGAIQDHRHLRRHRRSHARHLARSDFPSAAERDRLIKEYGADKGLVQTMARLDDYVSGAKPSARATIDRRP